MNIRRSGNEVMKSTTDWEKFGEAVNRVTGNAGHLEAAKSAELNKKGWVSVAIKHLGEVATSLGVIGPRS